MADNPTSAELDEFVDGYRQTVRQRADMVDSRFVTDAEIDGWVRQAHQLLAPHLREMIATAGAIRCSQKEEADTAELEEQFASHRAAIVAALAQLAGTLAPTEDADDAG